MTLLEIFNSEAFASSLLESNPMDRRIHVKAIVRSLNDIASLRDPHDLGAPARLLGDSEHLTTGSLLLAMEHLACALPSEAYAKDVDGRFLATQELADAGAVYSLQKRRTTCRHIARALRACGVKPTASDSRYRASGWFIAQQDAWEKSEDLRLQILSQTATRERAEISSSQ